MSGMRNTISNTMRTRKRSGRYTTMDKGFIEDDKLSYRAKGLLAYLLSKPDGWVAVVGDIKNHCTDGRDSVYAGLKELENAGYYEKRAVRNNDDGRIAYFKAKINEYPYPPEECEDSEPDCMKDGSLGNGSGKTISKTTRAEKIHGKFVIMDKLFLANADISLKAKGILAYLLCKPDGWITTVGDMIHHARDGKDSIYAGLRELKAAGYYAKRAIRDDKGRICRWEDTIYEYPEMAEEEEGRTPLPEFPEMARPDPDFPDTAKPDTVKPELEKPEHNKNEIILKMINTNNQSSLSAKQTDGQADDESVDIVTQYRAMLYGNVQYGALYRNYKEDIELINKILDIALDAIVSECDYMMIDGQRKPHSIVKSTLLKLSYCNIVDVLQQFGARTESIRKTKSYILSMLYNAVLEDGPRMINQYGCNGMAQ